MATSVVRVAHVSAMTARNSGRTGLFSGGP